MIDQNKLAQEYFNVLVSTCSENMISSLQTKAQIKVLSDVIAEKESVISELLSKMEHMQTIEKEYHAAVIRSQKLESQVSELQTRTSHLDSALKQIGEMKETIKRLEDELKTKEQTDSESKSKKKKEKVVEAVSESVSNDF